MSCYTCENCIIGDYDNCKNNVIGGKVTIPIYIDNNRNSRSVQSTQNDEYEMADLIAEGTILAVYTDESDSMVVILTEPENFYHSNCWIENVRLFQLRL
jgi:hypothetical protein